MVDISIFDVGVDAVEKLFYDLDNKLYTLDDLRKILLQIRANECETLFIHSDIMFGRPAERFKKRDYLETLYAVISELGVKNIVVPTFTYSFCNSEDYEIANSKTSMGAFNEFLRKQEGRYRTDDPLLSISVPMSISHLFGNISNHSLGIGSALDVIHHMDNVKFLFLGAEMADCFTYVHYVEKMMDVPYRFDMPFEGNIIYPDGKSEHRKQFIHTQCYGVKLPDKYDYFENEMEEKGCLKKCRFGDKYIGCLSEKDAYREIKAHIEKDINYYLTVPFREEDLVHKYTYCTANGRITHC